MAAPARALDIELPPETATYKPSDLPGFALVQKNCMTCHSAHYAQSQPPGSPRAYWEATVKKMKKPFGAQFPDEDVPAMVDYLSRTYGAERADSASAKAQPVVAAAATAAPATASSGGSAVAPRDAATLLAANNCSACHAVDKKVVGPAFKEVAARYAGKPDAVQRIAHNIRAGGAGKWGPVPMPPFPQITEAEAETLATYLLKQ